MFRIQITMICPGLALDEISEFLEWDLNAERLEILPASAEAPGGGLDFRHPWVSPETVAQRLCSEFDLTECDLRVKRVDPAQARGAEPAEVPPAAPPGPEEIRARLAQDGLVDRRQLAEGQGFEDLRAVDRALERLQEEGAIEAVSRHLFRAKVQPAHSELARPDPDLLAAQRRARPLEAHETVLLDALEAGEALGPAPLLAATGLSQGRLMSAATSLAERGLLEASGQGTRWRARLTETGLKVARDSQTPLPSSEAG